MKSKTLKLTAILLIFAGIFTACSCIKIEIHDETCPIKEILVDGKWEFVGIYYAWSSYTHIFQEPPIHIEYFIDGRMRLFDRRTNEYRYGTFAVEARKGTPFPWAPNEVIEYWHYSDHIDGLEPFSAIGVFRSKNEKVLFNYNDFFPALSIHKRKQ